MAAESGATASGQPSMRKITEASGTSQGKDGFKGECNHKKACHRQLGVTPPVFTRPGKTLSFPG